MELQQLISMIKKRPNMFFEKKDVIQLKYFISGFLMCKSTAGSELGYEKDFSNYFSAFAAEKFNKEPGYSWEKYFISEENNWEIFFEYAEEFIEKNKKKT